ncbi:MAG: pilus assembly FimT family protein [Gemmatimonadales bacterium]
MRAPSPCARGVTLLELMVVLAVLGLLIGIGLPALSALRPPEATGRMVRLREARAAAIRSGHAVQVMDTSRGLPGTVLFLPDGRAAGPGVDPLTGAPHDAAR